MKFHEKFFAHSRERISFVKVLLSKNEIFSFSYRINFIHVSLEKLKRLEIWIMNLSFAPSQVNKTKQHWNENSIWNGSNDVKKAVLSGAEKFVDSLKVS